MAWYECVYACILSLCLHRDLDVVEYYMLSIILQLIYQSLIFQNLSYDDCSYCDCHTSILIK